MPDARAALDALGDLPDRQPTATQDLDDAAPAGVAERLPISRPAVSRHLRLLKDAGLVDDAAEGTRRVYRLRAAGVEAIRAYFATVWGEAAARYTLVAENTDPRGEAR